MSVNMFISMFKYFYVVISVYKGLCDGQKDNGR